MDGSLRFLQLQQFGDVFAQTRCIAPSRLCVDPTGGREEGNTFPVIAQAVKRPAGFSCFNGFARHDKRCFQQLFLRRHKGEAAVFGLDCCAIQIISGDPTAQLVNFFGVIANHLFVVEPHAFGGADMQPRLTGISLVGSQLVSRHGAELLSPFALNLSAAEPLGETLRFFEVLGAVHDADAFHRVGDAALGAGNVGHGAQIGYASVPGGKPLMGGGVLGVASSSKKKEAALEFIRWACSERISLPFTLLGGISPCRKVYANTELLELFPWLSIVPSNYKNAVMRRVPVGMDEYAVERCIGLAVKSALSGVISPEDALRNAQLQLEKMIVK